MNTYMVKSKDVNYPELHTDNDAWFVICRQRVSYYGRGVARIGAHCPCFYLGPICILVLGVQGWLFN
jgi:hypothetical protein